MSISLTTLELTYMRHVTWELAYRNAISDIDFASQLTNFGSRSRNEIIIYNHHLNVRQHDNCFLLQRFMNNPIPQYMVWNINLETYDIAS